MKTSLGIWAFGNMATRFNPGGYKPELAGQTTTDRVRTAVAGLGDLIDDYEFHYPQELSPENLDEVREALDGHGIYCVASGLHLDPRFAKGALCSPDDATREEALRLDPGGDRPRRRDRRPDDHLARDRGLQLPVPDAVQGVLGAGSSTGSARRRSTRRSRASTVFLEHKNSEPAMKILMRNIGMTLHVIHTLRRQGIDNVTVNMDWQHLIMNGESLAEYAALLASEGLLGHLHANDGWGTFDDDNMVGTIRFMETIELAVELRRAGYGENGERLGFDLYPYTEDAVASVKRSVLQWRFIDGIASRIDDAALRAAQHEKDAVRAYELVYAAMGAVRSVRMRLQHVSVAIATDGADARPGVLRRSCSAWRRSPCRRSSIPNELVWFRVGGDLELHLMRTGDEPPPNAHFCLAVDSGLDELRARHRSGRSRDAHADRDRRPAALHVPRPVREPRRADRASRGVTALVGIDVGTSGVKALALTPEGEIVGRGRARVPALDPADPAGPSRTPRTGGARPRPRSPTSTSNRRRSASPARCTASSRSTSDDAGAASGDPLERPAHGSRVRRDRGARRARAADPADGQPRADRLHGAEAPLAPPPRARDVRPDRARPAAEGLRPAAADRRARDRRRGRLGHAPLRRREPPLERRGAATRSSSRPSGCRPRTSARRSARAGDQAAGALGVGVDRPGPALGRARHLRRRLRRAARVPARARSAAARLLPRGPGTWHAMGVMLSAAGSLQWLHDALGEPPYEELLAEAERVGARDGGPPLPAVPAGRAHAARRPGRARRLRRPDAPPRPRRAHACGAGGRRVRPARLARAPARARRRRRRSAASPAAAPAASSG